MKSEPHPLLQFFAYEHLPPMLQEVSKPFGELAQEIDETLPGNRKRPSPCANCSKRKTRQYAPKYSGAES